MRSAISDTIGGMSTNELLMRLQDALIESTRPSRQCTEAGGFVVMLTPSDPLVWINYAVPMSSRSSSVVGVREMAEVFRQHERTPRLEFFAELWPEVGSALEAEGFTCEKRMPIMILRRDEWHGWPQSHEIGPVDADSFRPLGGVLAEAFGAPPQDEPQGQVEDDPFFQRIAKGHTLAAIVRVDGEIVGGGFAVGTKEIREVAGIGTAAAHRRKGIAAAVIASLLDQFFGDGGEIAWLTPGDIGAQSVYERLGFRTIAEQVCYELSCES